MTAVEVGLLKNICRTQGNGILLYLQCQSPNCGIVESPPGNPYLIKRRVDNKGKLRTSFTHSPFQYNIVFPVNMTVQPPSSSSKGKLYLIPNTLGTNDTDTIPEYVRQIALHLTVFIVENIKEARRYLVKLGMKQSGRTIEELIFLELDKHASETTFAEYLKAAENGTDIGLISDAGCPAVADPGSIIVEWAHQKGIEVVPLVGPSSLLLALMSSGMNGQQFAFTGYLPIQHAARIQRLKFLEQRILSENQTQIFIETPYRNQSLFTDILNTCKPQLRLSIAANLTLPDQYIQTLSIQLWKKALPPDLHKIPTVFVLGN